MKSILYEPLDTNGWPLSFCTLDAPEDYVEMYSDDHPPVRQTIKEILLPLFIQVGMSDTLRADSLGFWRAGEDRFWLPRFVFQRTHAVKSRINVGIFAGIHGDEPASILGLVDFVRKLDAHPEVGRDFQLWIYPMCNPSGYVDGTRHSRARRDLNREFWKGSNEPEVRLLEEEIRRRKFDGM